MAETMIKAVILKALLATTTEADPGRRNEVIGKLQSIKATEPEQVLREVRALFNQQPSNVTGNVYQAGGNIYVGADPRPRFDSRMAIILSLLALSGILLTYHFIPGATDKTAEPAKLKEEIGTTSLKGEESQPLLPESVDAYRQTLTTHTPKRLQRDRAMTQNNLGNVLRAQGERIEGKEGMRLLAQAVQAYRSALTVYTRQQSPQQWAMTQDNLGLVLRTQGERMEGEAGVILLAQAVEAYQNALTVYTREHSPRQWAGTQNNLGIALTRQGERAAGEGGVRLLSEAVAAYREVLKVYTREQLPQDWAMTQNNLGLALVSQGERVEGQESLRLLGEAVTAYREALKVFTREHLLRQWATAQNNLAKALYLLKDWANAAEGYHNVLSLYPGIKEAYQRTSGIYHDILFRFQEAYELDRNWLQRRPNDLTARTDFAEKNFTTGSFVECEKMIASLLSVPEIKETSKVALRGVEVANALALGKSKQVKAKLDSLIAAIAAQPADFKVNWNFAGTLHFIGQNEKLANYREWLRQLFNAVQAENREAVLKALREARAKFKG